MEQAYTFYLRTSRLDLDDYNKEVEEGLHITSMAGTWMSIVEGFGGMRVKNDALHFEPRIRRRIEYLTDERVNRRNDNSNENEPSDGTTYACHRGVDQSTKRQKSLHGFPQSSAPRDVSGIMHAL